MNISGTPARHDAIRDDVAAGLAELGLDVRTEGCVEHNGWKWCPHREGHHFADILVREHSRDTVAIIEIKRHIEWPYQLRRARTQVDEYVTLSPRAAVGIILCPEIAPRVDRATDSRLHTPDEFFARIMRQETAA